MSWMGSIRDKKVHIAINAIFAGPLLAYGFYLLVIPKNGLFELYYQVAAFGLALALLGMSVAFLLVSTLLRSLLLKLEQKPDRKPFRSRAYVWIYTVAFLIACSPIEYGLGLRLYSGRVHAEAMELSSRALELVEVSHTLSGKNATGKFKFITVRMDLKALIAGGYDVGRPTLRASPYYTAMTKEGNAWQTVRFEENEVKRFKYHLVPQFHSRHLPFKGESNLYWSIRGPDRIHVMFTGAAGKEPHDNKMSLEVRDPRLDLPIYSEFQFPYENFEDKIRRMRRKRLDSLPIPDEDTEDGLSRLKRDRSDSSTRASDDTDKIFRRFGPEPQDSTP